MDWGSLVEPEERGVERESRGGPPSLMLLSSLPSSPCFTILVLSSSLPFHLGQVVDVCFSDLSDGQVYDLVSISKRPCLLGLLLL